MINGLTLAPDVENPIPHDTFFPLDKELSKALLELLLSPDVDYEKKLELMEAIWSRSILTTVRQIGAVKK